MFDYTEYRVLLACGPCDMRKNINGLCDIVMSQFLLDPREK
ncbi:MAG: IS66 family insertion sequence element accessory protein TnpB, partial [Eubacteriales bacterium]